MQSITGDELLQKLEGDEHLNILDVREPGEYAQGHIPQAQNLPLSALGKGLKDLKASQHYYIICASGIRSLLAAQIMAARGLKVTPVKTGMDQWKGPIA